MKAGGSPTVSLLEPCLRCRPRDQLPLPKHDPIYNVPIEMILRSIQLVVFLRTRDNLCALSDLTHVYRFWRMALIDQPQLRSTVFITQRDCRSFVEAWLERSYPVALEVIVDVKEVGWAHPYCACDGGGQGRLLPNESDPCEWHLLFESLAGIKHSNRIRALNINFDGRLWHTTGWGECTLEIFGLSIFQFVLSSAHHPEVEEQDEVC